ncbi:MAG: ATP-dependent Clp protease proteolytic subunit [Planctomycetes bacterium]|nr:ATP-dependent Clp protease proteolytic subunit [Planctomycetota bacterium]
MSPGNDDKENKEEKGPKGVADRLLKARTIILSGGISQKMAREVIGQLLALDAESDKPIRLFLNSQGGHVESGDTIYDTIKFIRSPVQMIGTGFVASAGVTIFLGARKDLRFCLPNTRFLIHQPSGGMRGDATDIWIEAEEIVKMRQRLNELIARETGQGVERVEKDTDRNCWMSAEEAIAYGLLGRIIRSAKELPS